MDPITLATAVTSVLAPYIKKAGVATMDKLAENLPESVGKIWDAIASRSERVTVAAKDLASDTGPDNQEILQQQLQTALQLTLKKDEELANLITGLIDKAKSEAGISNTGNGALANNNSVAVGNLKVNGNTGTISIGNKLGNS